MPRILQYWQLLLLLGAVLLPALAFAEEPDSEETRPLVFETDVLPILKSHCAACHFGDQPKAGLDLRRRATIVKGGKSGPAIRISAAETSLIWEVLKTDRMPLKGPALTAEEKGIIRSWINEGAEANDKEVLAVDEASGTYDAADFDYWSFHPPRMPEIPTPRDQHLVQNPVDAFLLEQLEARQLSFSSQADRNALVRRLFLDLAGTLPSPAEIDLFVHDKSPDAYERLVDRLLGNPQYGERWGRHWLDVAGYSDSAGVLSADQDRQLIWRYRDYVIRAFNRDLPYDYFVKQQLAGDELSGYWSHFSNDDTLPENVVESLTATGFLRTAPDSSRPDFNTIKNVNGQYYYPTIDAQLEIVASSLMGISVKCAKCHNHKFDPLTQREYYQLQSIFMAAYNPDKWIPFRDRTRPIATQKQLDEAQQREQEVNSQVAALNKEIAELKNKYKEQLFSKRLASISEAIRLDVRQALATSAEQRTEIQKYLADKFSSFLQPDDEALATALAATYPDYTVAMKEKSQAIAAQEQRRIHFDKVYALFDVEGEPSTPLLRRGDAQTPGPQVSPNVPRLAETNSPFQWEPPGEDARSSGRRMALANWLTQPRHPLTARVLANRVWMHHFGEGIISTLDDFGWAGDSPTHPELLDYLAIELADHDWSVKHLHRLIVTSTAYRQRSLNEGDLAIEQDPHNRLLWRQNLRRLEAEPLRDTILQLAGGLDNRMFGYPVAVAQRSNGEVVVNDGKLPQRKSIYLRVKRSAPVSILQLFDQPDIETNCTRRSQSTVPLQALSLLNSDMVSHAAAGFARRALAESPQDPAGWAYRAAYSRAADQPVRESLSLFLEQQTALHLAGTGQRKAWQYGYGSMDSQDDRKVLFTHFPAFVKQQWQLGSDYPFQGSFWAGLNATAGHPGSDKPVIVQWTSPLEGTIRIRGFVEHPSPAGNGIRNTVVSSQDGKLSSWVTAHEKKLIKVDNIQVVHGDRLWVITDMNEELTSDNFNWTIVIEHLDDRGEVVTSWDSTAGFHGPLAEGDNLDLAKRARQKALVDLCHVLLASNGFAYID
ncbi:MAG: PSD1 and planctomycete cytochrome C domain-containing protein [Pirellulaceae bacterium]